MFFILFFKLFLLFLLLFSQLNNLLLLLSLLLFVMSLFNTLGPVSLMHHISDVSKVMPTMRRSTMNDHTIQLKLMILPIVNQMCQLLFQIKLKIRVQFDPIHCFEIKPKPIQSEHQNVWEMFESCSQIHVLLWLTHVAKYLILSFHNLWR